MSKYRYVGLDERVFPDAMVVVGPGDVIEAAANPDPRYFESDEPVVTAGKTATASAAPAEVKET